MRKHYDTDSLSTLNHTYTEMNKEWEDWLFIFFNSLTHTWLKQILKIMDSNLHGSNKYSHLVRGI